MITAVTIETTERKRHHRPADANLVGARNARSSASTAARELRAAAQGPSPTTPPSDREHAGFREELLREAAATRAEREPQSDFAAANRHARDEQVDDVRRRQ